MSKIPFFTIEWEEFEPKKPDFEPEIKPDFDDSLCPVCSNRLDKHSTNMIVDCALIEVKGGQKN